MGDVVDIGEDILGATPAGRAVDEAFLKPAREAKGAARDAAKDRREVRAISGAQKETERQLAIKSQLREERVRRAQLEVAGESSGIGGSSSVTGVASANKATTSAGQAFATGQSFANTAQSDLLQSAADFELKGQEALAKGQLIQSGINLGFKVAGAV